jgi:hypothetical protein
MGARWYLACIAMLALLCVAAHLSVQMHAQQKAARLLLQWGKEAQVQIGDIHYHLLRNALIVKQIHIARQGGSLSIAHMLIRANPELLTSNSPQIGKIEIVGVQARLWDPEAENTWQQDEYLKRIWHASRVLSLRDGELVIFPKGETALPLEMTGLQLQQDYLNQQRNLVGSAHTREGNVHVQWQINEGDGSSSGELRWQKVEAQRLNSLLGLQPEDGLLTGHMSWSQSGSEQPGMQLEGQMQLSNADDESNDSHQLYWQGSQEAETWKIKVQAKAWPLDAWADVLPQIGGRKMLAGHLDGTLQWRGQPGRWNVNADQGVLRNVIYAQENERKPADWHINRLEYNSAQIDQSQLRFHASSILLADAKLTLQPVPSLAVEPSGQKPERDWRIAIDDIRIQNMSLGLSLPQGNVTAAALDGKGRWKPGEALNYRLKTQTAVGQAYTAQAGETVKRAEYWQLRGQIPRNQVALNDANLNIQARNVPLAKLRALVPLTGSKTSPLTLEGNTSLKLDVSVHDGAWQAAGIATAEKVVLAHAGDTWQMDHLAMTFGPVGMGLDSQSMDLLEVQGWKYIAALKPLSAYSAAVPAEAEATRQAAWWVRPLRRQNWHIDSVRLNNGTVSLGHSDDHWARQLDIHLDQLQMDQWSEIHMLGKVGGGDFKLDGSWDALGETNQFRGTASLQNALPFFLNNWMTASGMPRLVRGRLFAGLSVDAGDAPDSYQGSVQLKFLRGLTEMSPAPDDPMLSRIGFGTSDALARLNDGAGTAALQFEFGGNWRAQPLNLDRLGMSMQPVLQQAVMQQIKQDDPSLKKQEQTIETRIRLHKRGSLSPNERTRLFKTVRLLRRHPDWVVDLTPHWTGDEIEADMFKRMLYTQQLIEKYFSVRRVARQRIFPLLPTAENQADEVGSIWVSIGPPA